MSGDRRCGRPTAPARGETSHVAVGADIDALEQILRPEINLAIWRRKVPRAIAEWLAACPADEMMDSRKDIDVRLPAACIPAALLRAIPIRTNEQRTGVSALVRDAACLADIMVRLTGEGSVRVRLEWITEQACPNFHIDRLPYRIVCTYKGPGTQWLPDESVVPTGTSGGALHMADIRHLIAGEVAVMRGLPNEEYLGVPLRHRSPPVEHPRDLRLFLAIDSADSGRHSRLEKMDFRP